MKVAITIQAVVEVSQMGFDALNRKSSFDLLDLVCSAGLGKAKVEQTNTASLVEDEWDLEFIQGTRPEPASMERQPSEPALVAEDEVGEDLSDVALPEFVPQPQQQKPN